MEALNALDEQNRNVHALARCAVIASRIEPALLRTLRFELLPHADVASEADVWWSDLVDLRAADAIRFSIRGLHVLYRELADDPALVRAAYRIVRRVHRDASPFARLQEWLCYRALVTPDHRCIANMLAAIADAIVRDSARRDEAAVWAVTALPRLPAAVRTLPAFWSLMFAANRHGRSIVLIDEEPPAAALSHSAELIPEFLAGDPIELEIARDGEDLLLRPSDRPPIPDGLLVPDVAPVILGVQSGNTSRVVSMNGPGWTRVPAATLPIAVETIDGRRYELRGVEDVHPPHAVKGREIVKAIFGLHVAATTTLSLTARAGAVASHPVLTISTRSGIGQRVGGKEKWKASLSAGEHLVQLHGDIEGPIEIRIDPAAVFVSLAGTKSNALIAWMDTQATVDGDPWPPPIVTSKGPSAVEALAGPGPAYWFNSLLAPMADRIVRSGVRQPPIHALLIGIDYYPDATPPHRTLFHNLGGCVRDVLEVDAFLRERLDVPSSQITCLLSPLPGVDALGTHLPTYDNIVSAWKRLIYEVPSGEQIYIHFSGNGGRVKTCMPEVKGTGALDEALAPCDVNDRAKGRFLRDVEVARLLEQMTERRHFVTIVIDACHSSGLSKGEVFPRCGLAADLEPRPSDGLGSAVASPAELAATVQRGAGSRSAGDAWHFGPNSGVLVAACRQNEFAFEYAFDGHVRRGALTYFWLETLDRRGPSLSYRAALRSINADMIAYHLPQTAMVVGDADREVLGLQHIRPVRAIPVLAVDNHRITLLAGMASLMRRGMRLAIAPPDAVTDFVELAGLPEVEVGEVGAAQSIARRIDDKPGEIVVGAQAIPLRYTQSVTRLVKWMPSGLAGEEEARRTLTEALAADPSRLVAAAPDDTAAHYFVTTTPASATGEFEYRVDDAAGVPVRNLGPAIGVADQHAAARVVSRIVHLARFSSVHTLDNSDPHSPLAGRFELELLALPDDFQHGDPVIPRPFIGGQPDNLPHNTWICLRLRNRSVFELHAVVLDLQPDWGISKAVPSDLPFLQLAPDTVYDTAIRAWLPRGYDSSTDILKAIATVEPTAFDWLCLDPLDQLDGHRGPLKGIPMAHLRQAIEGMRSATRTVGRVVEANVPTRAWTTVQRVLTVVADRA